MKHALPSSEEQWVNDVAEALGKELEDRDMLIRWLSRTYNDNDPTFPFFGLDQEPLENSRRCWVTWQIVVRGLSREKAEEYLQHILEGSH